MNNLTTNSYETRAALTNILSVAMGAVSRMAAGSLTDSETQDIEAIMSAEISRQINERKED